MKKHFPFIVFIIVMITVGLSVYRDYGVPWDEEPQMKIGEMNAQYIMGRDDSLLSHPDRYHGPFFEVFLYAMTHNLSFPTVTYVRHLCIFLLYIVGVIALYLLAFRLFHHSGWALLSVIMFVLSPRIIGESFYNSKDIPFLSFFILAILFIVNLVDVNWEGRRWSSRIIAVLFSSIFSACAVAIRMPGIVLLAITGILFSLSFIHSTKLWKRTCFLFLIYLSLTLLFVVLFWPTLWQDPIHEIINAFVDQSHYKWNMTMLFQGEFIEAMEPVGKYIPTWIMITTPIICLVGFAVGVIFLAIQTFKKSVILFSRSIKAFCDNLTSDDVAWLAIVSWLVLPLGAIILLRSNVYDGWRQMYFIYPSIVLGAVYGIKKAFDSLEWLFHGSIWVTVITCGVVILGLFEPFGFILQHHPHENVYFNVLAGDPSLLRQKYEQDYWGLSYKQGIDYLLAHDPSPLIKISLKEYPGEEYIKYMLDPEQASRLELTLTEDADYFITTFRWHPEDYEFDKEYYSINIRGTKILVIYKME